MSTQLNDELQFCSFRLAGRLFGVDILDVKEVSSELRITPIAHAPSSVAGYLNLRGQIHLVVDLRRLFRFDPYVLTPKSRVVIFKSSVDEPFGVIIDCTDEVFKVRRDRIEERRKVGEILTTEQQERRKASAELTQGVCRLEKDLMVVLNARGILCTILELETQAKEKTC